MERKVEDVVLNEELGISRIGSEYTNHQSITRKPTADAGADME
jgi:hypothetical protein